MSYIWMSISYPTLEEAHAAIAADFLQAGGLNDRADIEEILGEYENDELAADACEYWELYGSIDWFDMGALIDAFAEYRNSDWAEELR